MVVFFVSWVVFFVKFCLFSLFNLCVVSINFCIVFFWFVIGGIFSFRIYFSLCCDFPPNFFFFSGDVFLKKLISVIGLFVCSWFCTISVRDPFDVMEFNEHFKNLKKKSTLFSLMILLIFLFSFFVKPVHIGCTQFLHKLQLIQCTFLSFFLLVFFS